MLCAKNNIFSVDEYEIVFFFLDLWLETNKKMAAIRVGRCRSRRWLTFAPPRGEAGGEDRLEKLFSYFRV